jgi:hypothetical protein
MCVKERMYRLMLSLLATAGNDGITAVTNEEVHPSFLPYMS